MLLLFVAVILVEFCDGAVWKWQNYPNPLNDPTDICKRGGNTSWTCDPDSIISRSDADKVDILLKKIRTSTSTKCSLSNDERGYRVGVAIAEQIYNDGKSKEPRFRSFACNVRERRWKLPSRSECDDLVLIVLSKNDRYVYISAGSEARKKLTDCAVKKVINEMRTSLSQNRFGPGLVNGVEEIYLYLSGKKSSGLCSSQKDTRSQALLVVAIILVVIGVLFVMH